MEETLTVYWAEKSDIIAPMVLFDGFIVHDSGGQNGSVTTNVTIKCFKLLIA